ncbi:MAG: hypothetical protein ACREF9_07770, partial [Opitutaceae bacterium]
MNDIRLSPDDPKLTAYALGELTGDERAAVEAALRQRPALQSVVEEIRATAAQLGEALASEPVFRPSQPGVANAGIVIDLNGRSADGAMKRAVGPHSPPRAARQRAKVNGNDPYRISSAGSKLLRFPQFYYLVATAAAACFAVLVALRNSPVPSTARPVGRSAETKIALQPAGQEPASAPSPIEALPAETRVADASLSP